MKPTLNGCSQLFWLVRSLLPLEQYPRDSDIGALIGLKNSETSNWKKGKRVIKSFSQFLILANVCGANVDDMYGVACEHLHQNMVRQVRTSMDLNVPKVTPIGSALLFFHIKQRLTEQNHGKRVTGGQVGAVLGFAPSGANRWKRGSGLITRADHFYVLAEISGDSAEYLYSIASSRQIPDHLSKYVMRATKYTSRKPRKTLK